MLLCLWQGEVMIVLGFCIMISVAFAVGRYRIEKPEGKLYTTEHTKLVLKSIGWGVMALLVSYAFFFWLSD